MARPSTLKNYEKHVGQNLNIKKKRQNITENGMPNMVGLGLEII